MDGTDQVVVPLAPAPLRPVRPARDDLDELIDEVLPDTNEGPGRFDILLLVAGGGLLGWGACLGGPKVATLLRGRRPAHEAERQYVSERADAIDRFSSSLSRRNLPLLEARRELEEFGGTSSLKRKSSPTRQEAGMARKAAVRRSRG